MRRLIVLPLLAAVVLAACGSTSTTSAPSGSPAASGASSAPPAVSASVAPATPAPTPTLSALQPDASQGPLPTEDPVESMLPATPAPSLTTACQKLTDSVNLVTEYLSFFSVLDRSMWPEMIGPDSPIEFDRKDFQRAISTIAKVKGTAAIVKQLKEIDRVLGVALGLKDPFAEKVLTGPQLVKLANDDFTPIGQGMEAAEKKAGCLVP